MDTAARGHGLCGAWQPWGVLGLTEQKVGNRTVWRGLEEPWCSSVLAPARRKQPGGEGAFKNPSVGFFLSFLNFRGWLCGTHSAQTHIWSPGGQGSPAVLRHHHRGPAVLLTAHSTHRERSLRERRVN